MCRCSRGCYAAPRYIQGGGRLTCPLHPPRRRERRYAQEAVGAVDGATHGGDGGGWPGLCFPCNHTPILRLGPRVRPVTHKALCSDAISRTGAWPYPRLPFGIRCM